MVSICSKQNMTWVWKKYVPIHHQIIHNHIGNVCLIVVQNVQVLIYQVHNQIITIKMLFLQYVLICII